MASGRLLNPDGPGESDMLYSFSDITAERAEVGWFTRPIKANLPADVVGRHSGDEFVVLIFGAETHGELESLVDRLRVLLAEPVVIADTKTPIRASVGLAEVHRDDQRTAEEILRDADWAMYTAQRGGLVTGASNASVGAVRARGRRGVDIARAGRGPFSARKVFCPNRRRFDALSVLALAGMPVGIRSE